MAGVAPPNYTQIPNEILDLMADMQESELRVLLAIARKTFGWHKDRDTVSLTQLEKLTGMARQSVHNGIMAAIDRGLLERRPAGKQSFSYRLLVQPPNQSNDKTSLMSRPVEEQPVQSLDQQPVYSLDTQKKELKKYGGGVNTPSNESAEVRRLSADAAAADVQEGLIQLGLTKAQAATALNNIPTLTSTQVEQLVQWRATGKRTALLAHWLCKEGRLPDDLVEAKANGQKPALYRQPGESEDDYQRRMQAMVRGL